MSPISTQRTIFDVVRWIGLLGTESFGWGVLIRPDAGSENDLDHLREELQTQLDVPLRVIDAAGRSVVEFLQMLRDPPNDLVLVTGLDQWSGEEFQSLDVMRSALARPGVVLLWLRRGVLVRLFQRAPNLRSWIGGSVYGVHKDRGLMTQEERRVRLDAFSQHFALTDEEVVARAKRKSLPPDPEFVEWLILLDRADLVG